MSAKIPGGGFFPAAGFSALANVGGGGRRLLGYRDETRPFRGPAIRLGPGIVLLAFTMLDENFRVKPKMQSSVFETPYRVLFPMVLALLLFLLLTSYWPALLARSTGGVQSIAARGNLLE
jgi:hypothetical protein